MEDQKEIQSKVERDIELGRKRYRVRQKKIWRGIERDEQKDRKRYREGQKEINRRIERDEQKDRKRYREGWIEVQSKVEKDMERDRKRLIEGQKENQEDAKSEAGIQLNWAFSEIEPKHRRLSFETVLFDQKVVVQVLNVLKSVVKSWCCLQLILWLH